MKKLSRWLCLAVVLSLPALGQVDEAPPKAVPHSVGEALLGFVSPGGFASVLGVVLSVVGGIAWMTGRRRRILASVLHRAYQGVNDIAVSDDVTDGWDKAAAFMVEVDKRLVAAGWRPLNPEEKELAQLEAKALHGAEQQAIKIASAAAVAGAEAGSSARPS